MGLMSYSCIKLSVLNELMQRIERQECCCRVLPEDFLLYWAGMPEREAMSYSVWAEREGGWFGERGLVGK